MKVLITGAAGQLGRALLKTAPGTVEIQAAGRELDICVPAALADAVRSFKPALIV
ncbi:MAG: sugar nucleotide-binding protein, partial [Gammaproteobacteria bacterium]|nr:sugar nucleotide-binding protein [Gammaproteobacteria bacterium]